MPNDYLKYSNQMMLLAYAGAAETMPSHSPHGKSLKLVAMLSLCVKSTSLQERNAICRSPRQIETYSLG